MQEGRVLGWGFVDNARKAHYFDEQHKSLCGRWLLWRTDAEWLPKWDTADPLTCVSCRAKALKRAPKEE